MENKNLGIVIDSSVFLSALGTEDQFSLNSKKFFQVVPPETTITLPALVIAEIIVNLKKISPLPPEFLKYFEGMKIINLDFEFLKKLAETKGPDILKTSDFIIALTAKLHQAVLITWDKKHLSSDSDICESITPSEFVEGVDKTG